MNALQAALVNAGVATERQVDQTVEKPHSLASIECPTGKVAYPSKKAAKHDTAYANSRPMQRSAARPYRCDYCSYIHIGHGSRGRHG